MNKPFLEPTAKSAVNVRALTTPRGLGFWLVEDYAVPIVAVEFAFPGGATHDPAGKAGAATMLAGLLDEGAGDLDSQAFQQALDEKAVEISFHADRDFIGGRLRTLARHLDRGGELLRMALNTPRLDQEPFERVHEQMNARIRHDANDPAHMAGKAWRERVFAGHPYALSAEGDLDTLAALTRDDLRATARSGLARERVVIAVVGAISQDKARKLVDGVFADLPATPELVEMPRAPFAGLGDEVQAIDLDVPQTTIRFGRPALERDDPDYLTSVVLAHVLGGGTGLSSRLFREVCEKRGLAYSVSASVATFDRASYIYGGTTTKNERAFESMDVIRAEILDMAQGHIGEEELDKGKKYLIGSYPLRFDTSTKIAQQLAHMQLDGYGLDWLVERNRRIGAVTLDDARRTARRLFGDGSLSVTMVGRPTKS